ncbi:MAG: branched-chain amino acid ABC transporter substrate-binding protein [Salinarimonadaceae bacterium]|nr:MAG: branched-chain amino acid ABC transporter substrate-binding protein [Salinarimonadaceae bacterium]
MLKISGIWLGAVGVLGLALAAPSEGWAKDQVRLAYIGPLTGPLSSVGIGARNSIELAVRQRNADPDATYEYVLEAFDDECKADVGLRVATRAAADDGIVVGFPHYCSAVAIGAVGTYNRFELPVVLWGAVLPDITYGNDYKEIHRVNGTMINQNEHAANFVVDQGYQTWAIIHDTTDYGRAHNEYFSRFLTEAGGEIVGTFGVTADQQDFSSELAQIASLRPDVLYFGGQAQLGVRIRAQMERLGVTAQFQGTSGILSDAYLEGLPPALSEGTLAFLEGAPVDQLPGGAAFVAAYQEAGFGEPFEAYGPFAYSAASLAIDLIEEVGPDRIALRDALNGVSGYDSAIGEITFDESGQNTVAVISTYVVQDGQWTVWEDSDYASGLRSLRQPN